jgi:hypothetical protein
VASGWGVTNGIRADSHGFTGAYRSVDKDTVAYGLRTWVHTHDAWVLMEGYGMVRMLVLDVQTWPGGTFLAWG